MEIQPINANHPKSTQLGGPQDSGLSKAYAATLIWEMEIEANGPAVDMVYAMTLEAIIRGDIDNGSSMSTLTQQGEGLVRNLYSTNPEAAEVIANITGALYPPPS